MKKKTVALIVVLALVVAGAAYVAFRLKIRGTDIIGVTTLPDRNTVIMNSKTGDEFVGGTGYVNIGEGERIRVKCALSAGEIDLLFYPSDFYPSFQSTLEDWPISKDAAGEGSFGQDGVSGKDDLYFDAAPGVYAVSIAPHGSIGKVVITTAKAG